jgi:V/A-type H+-transporting ATPase subunit C
LGRTEEYAYLNAYVRALKSKMLTRQDFESLLKSKDVEATLRILEETSYGPYVRALTGKEFSARELEEAIFLAYQDTCKQVLQAAESTSAKGILELTMERQSADCLKAVIRCVLQRLPFEESIQSVVPSGRYTYERCASLLRLPSLRQIPDLVEPWELRKPLSESIPECERLKSSLPAEATIDRFFFDALWDKVMSLPDGDRSAVERIIGTEIDLINISLLLTAKKFGLSQVFLRDFLLPKRYRLGTEFDQATAMPSVIDALRTISQGYYSKPFGETLESLKKTASLLVVEIACKRYLARKSLSAFLGYPFSAAIPLAFLHLKLFEAQDIRAIIFGKKDKVQDRRVEELLILFSQMAA